MGDEINAKPACRLQTLMNGIRDVFRAVANSDQSYCMNFIKLFLDSVELASIRDNVTLGKYGTLALLFKHQVPFCIQLIRWDRLPE